MPRPVVKSDDSTRLQTVRQPPQQNCRFSLKLQHVSPNDRVEGSGEVELSWIAFYKRQVPTALVTSATTRWKRCSIKKRKKTKTERRPTSSRRPEQPTINPTSYTTPWDLTAASQEA